MSQTQKDALEENNRLHRPNLRDRNHESMKGYWFCSLMFGFVAGNLYFSNIRDTFDPGPALVIEWTHVASYLCKTWVLHHQHSLKWFSKQELDVSHYLLYTCKCVCVCWGRGQVKEVEPGWSVVVHDNRWKVWTYSSGLVAAPSLLIVEDAHATKC